MFAPAGRITARAGLRSKLAAIVLAAKRSPLRTPKLWSSSKKAKKRRSAAFFFTLFHSSPIDPPGLDFLLGNSGCRGAQCAPVAVCLIFKFAGEQCSPLQWSLQLFVGGGVLDAPQVCVVDRFDVGGCLPWFVGRGLDPSTCDNPNPSGASGTPPPTSKFQMANGIGGVKTPPYSTIGKGDVGGDACIAPQRPPKRADDEHRPLQYGSRGILAPKGSIWEEGKIR